MWHTQSDAKYLSNINIEASSVTSVPHRYYKYMREENVFVSLGQSSKTIENCSCSVQFPSSRTMKSVITRKKYYKIERCVRFNSTFSLAVRRREKSMSHKPLVF